MFIYVLVDVNLYNILSGPDTTNFEWESWGDWSECVGSCGGVGTQTRHRECTPPSYGGYECPAATDSEVGECEMAPCPSKWAI